MKRIPLLYRIFALVATGLVLAPFACTKPDADYHSAAEEWLSGGQQTVYDEGSNAYSHVFPVLAENLERVHEVGDAQFGATFVSPPAVLNAGRGPIFNNVSCAACHISDGRGKVPGAGDSSISTLFRISMAGVNAVGGPMPVPGFGDQIQNRANYNTVKEADVLVHYEEKTFSFGDGSSYSLRFPSYQVTNAYTALPADIMLSARVAAPVFGLGLIAGISEADVLARADENDADGDGISGRPNWVWDVQKKSSTLGRFGWKANQPSLLQQIAAAYNGDMGVTSSIFPVENCVGQPQDDHRADDPELSDSLLYANEFYVRTLAVPARRNLDDPQVQAGKALFNSSGCVKCHIPDQRTAADMAFPAISNQLIHPYTDLLLHDMGSELADGRPDFKATGSEWRTAPLWGIGLTQKVNGHSNFLHDGRARSLLEAVLWHGGEAASAKEKVRAMSAAERASLVKFLESL